MIGKNLLDIETLVKIKKAAQEVTPVPFGMAAGIVKEMENVSSEKAAFEDQTGMSYWTSTLKALATATNLQPKEVGTICREIGLELWREGDGCHVAWSEPQIEILKKHFYI